MGLASGGIGPWRHATQLKSRLGLPDTQVEVLLCADVYQDCPTNLCCCTVRNSLSTGCRWMLLRKQSRGDRRHALDERRCWTRRIHRYRRRWRGFKYRRRDDIRQHRRKCGNWRHGERWRGHRRSGRRHRRQRGRRGHRRSSRRHGRECGWRDRRRKDRRHRREQRHRRRNRGRSDRRHRREQRRGRRNRRRSDRRHRGE